MLYKDITVALFAFSSLYFSYSNLKLKLKKIKYIFKMTKNKKKVKLLKGTSRPIYVTKRQIEEKTNENDVTCVALRLLIYLLLYIFDFYHKVGFRKNLFLFFFLLLFPENGCNFKSLLLICEAK